MTLSPVDRVRSPIGENVNSMFSSVTFGAQCGAFDDLYLLLKGLLCRLRVRT